MLVATIFTLASMSFISTVNANPFYEDFTIYTEVDGNNHITITNSTYLTFTSYNNEDAYLYYDKGTNHFSSNFQHKLDVRALSYLSGINRGCFWALTNDIDDIKGLSDNNKNCLLVFFQVSVAGSWSMRIRESYSGSDYEDIGGVSVSTWYYLLIERSTSTFTCKIYDNATNRDLEGTPEVDTLTITLQEVVAYRYVFASVSENQGGGGGRIALNLNCMDLLYDYEYTFYGLYDETTGNRDGAVNVTAYYPEGISPETFGVDGMYMYGSYNKPVYFLFNLTNDREYWLGADDDTETIYIFDDTTTTYTISFMDFAGILDEFSYVEAKRYVNATLRIVEKRQVDVENKIIMNLVNGVLYTLIIGDGQEYTYGDLRVTDDTSIVLTLKSVDFPKETLLTYKNVRIYGLRAFDNPTGNITITYEDLLEETTSVDIYINYKNGTNVYNATVSSDSFVHTWASAENDTDYAVVCDIDHQRYGEYTWRNYFPRTFSEMPWGLGFLGTLPFNTAYILPAFLLLFVGGCFTVINAQLGAFVTVVLACILAYIGWLPIPAATLIVAFTLAILMALIYAKRRVTIG